MVTIHKIQTRFGGNICRSCLNETYRANLERADCQYDYPFPTRCACCKEMKNIVTDLRLSGKRKLLFR